MSNFEFVLIIFAMVAGFAISELMGSWGRIVRKWTEFRNKGFYLSISLWMVFNLIGHFTGLWEYREVQFTPLVGLIAFLPTLVFSVSMTIAAVDSETATDLNVHYRAVCCRKALPLAVLAVVLSTLTDYLPGVGRGVSLLPLGLLGVALVSLISFSNRYIHIAAHSLLWLLIGAFTIIGHISA